MNTTPRSKTKKCWTPERCDRELAKCVVVKTLEPNDRQAAKCASTQCCMLQQSDHEAAKTHRRQQQLAFQGMAVCQKCFYLGASPSQESLYTRGQTCHIFAREARKNTTWRHLVTPPSKLLCDGDALKCKHLWHIFSTMSYAIPWVGKRQRERKEAARHEEDLQDYTSYYSTL